MVVDFLLLLVQMVALLGLWFQILTRLGFVGGKKYLFATVAAFPTVWTQFIWLTCVAFMVWPRDKEDPEVQCNNSDSALEDKKKGFF